MPAITTSIQTVGSRPNQWSNRARDKRYKEGKGEETKAWLFIDDMSINTINIKREIHRKITCINSRA